MTAKSIDDSRVAAQAVHDLGAALWFGGSVMGVAGVNKAGEDLRDGVDKVRVAESAWRRFAPAQWLGDRCRAGGGVAADLGEQGPARRAVRPGTRGAAQAALAVAGAGATAYAAWSGTRIGQLTERARERGEPFDTDGRHGAERRGRRRRCRSGSAASGVAQYLVPVLAGANIVLNACLDAAVPARRDPGRDRPEVAPVLTASRPPRRHNLTRPGRAGQSGAVGRPRCRRRRGRGRLPGPARSSSGPARCHPRVAREHHVRAGRVRTTLVHHARRTRVTDTQDHARPRSPPPKPAPPAPATSTR